MAAFRPPCWWHFSACPDSMFEMASRKKGRGIWLPALAKGTSESDGTASKPDLGHTAKCSAVLTALEQSLETSEIAGLGFGWGFFVGFGVFWFVFLFGFLLICLLVCFCWFVLFLNSFTAELYQVTQAKCGKAWKPGRHYLYIFTNPAIHQFSCSEIVLWFWIFFPEFFSAPFIWRVLWF